MNRPPSPVPSCVSVSDNSINLPPDLSSDRTHPDPLSKMNRPPSPVPSCVSVSDNSINLPPDLSSDRTHPDPLELESEPAKCTAAVGEQVAGSGLSSNKQPDHEVLKRVMRNHKASMKRKFQNTSEGINKQGAETLLEKIYIDLYITEGESERVNKEHEIWQVELSSKAQITEDTAVNCNDIFKPLPGQEKHIRTVMTKGVAGIGKTVSVQKFILDWSKGAANMNVEFIFTLSFRELNLIKGDQYSLHQLLLDFHPELRELKNSEEYKDCQVVFIFDGLDESRISLHFQPDKLVSDVKQTSSVDVLLTSLIQGYLLPSALIWITSRPAAASQIPAQNINRVTEVRGFSDSRKEEYFRKRISDKSQSDKIISHIKKCRSLHIMCHIPIFCWIAATVLQQMLEKDNTQEIPKSLTEMFIHFLLVQTTRKNQKYQIGMETNKKHQQSQNVVIPKEIVLKLAKLAFKNLENGNVMFYEEDLRECGIDVTEASVYSGMCTELFKEESVFHQRKIYCFVHLSIQEFLAALHIFVSYSSLIENTGTFIGLEELLKYTVNKTLERRNGHLDLFLRFLMGICLESNQRLLQGLLNHTHDTSKSIKEICHYIKELNREDLSPERYISLLQCLSEVNDCSMHEEIQQYLKSPKVSKKELTPAHCSALAHMILMSEEVMDEFDLKEYKTSEEGHRRMIPALRCSRKARLDRCKLDKMSCETVRRSLQLANSLIHLDLSHNALGDSGVQILSAGLFHLHNKLQTLRLGDCQLGNESCKIVAHILQSPNSLIELDLSHNDVGDSGVQLLSEGLNSPFCRLQTLRLSGCLISEIGCGFLASALTSNHSHLKELDLSYNHPGESAAALKNPQFTLKTLNVDHCAEIRFRPGVQKYACELTLDPNTAGRNLLFSEGNRAVTLRDKEQPYPDHPERFDVGSQVLCREGLSGCCYWEAEWSGNGAYVAVAYKSIGRKGDSNSNCVGFNEKSWSLWCSPYSCIARHNNRPTTIPLPRSRFSRIGVYLNVPAGMVSFYSISSGTLTHMHTFYSTFTEPLYPGFRVFTESSVSLCKVT